MKKLTKIILAIFITVALLWGIIGVIDYSLVKGFEKPRFAIPTVTYDDGGSGTYHGLWYSFQIEGNFMPEDEQPGVTYYEYYLFGKLIKTGTTNNG
ncbi:hypothetical protein J2T56_000997 [Natronobacillus azotifigens]|uniref:Uncharacterized protein n=1 Tax=Natronobacillus azotifigens TaxID=472978 RepID=A0A9J6R9S5_9BACI|nr:hypothetical protein [Natronobacillus azotifigens]MCZ0702434.1 hypothetical protein [Natronobacillus azotifigens]